MFQKVLIAEDIDIINSGLLSTLKEVNIVNVTHVSYCDEALLKLRKAFLDDDPFQLLISDLSFIEDHNQQEIKSGDDLIAKVRAEFPDLKIIVFSVEDKPYRIQNLYKNCRVNAYVWKNRNAKKELKKAIKTVFITDEFYISPDLSSAIHPKQAVEITDYDIHIMKYLSKGVLQDDLPRLFKEKEIKPSGKSSIEKRLKFLKEHFKANNPTHLVAIAKDFGLI
tara:strand:- start:1852 stop:2520 length:669 start_codon:yes stop_codon:yes gene_type:complete